MKQHIRSFGAVASMLTALLLLFGISSAHVAQAAPFAQDATPIPGDDAQLLNPSVGANLSQNPYSVSPGEVDVFSFEHAGGGQAIHIWMDAEPNNGAGFKIFRENAGEAILNGADPDRFRPVGAGTANELEPGWLFWRGTMETPGRFYLVVENGWNDSVPYDLIAYGPGLVARSTGPVMVRTMNADTASMDSDSGQMGMNQTGMNQTGMMNDGVPVLPGRVGPLTDPPVEQALAVNNYSVSPGSWDIYTFKLDSNKPMHIWMDAEPNIGAGFKIFNEAAGSEIAAGANPDRFEPIGAGTPNENEPGWLFWRGTTDNDARLYVVVENGWSDSVPYAIYATGPGFVPMDVQ